MLTEILNLQNDVITFSLSKLNLRLGSKSGFLVEIHQNETIYMSDFGGTRE